MMKFNGTGELQNVSKMVHEILTTRMKDEIDQLEDGYGIDAKLVEGLSMSIFVNHNKKVLWTSTNTRFTKAYDKEVNRLIEENIASFEDLGILLYLSTKYTGHEDNYLRIDGKYVTKKDLIEDLHIKTESNTRSSQSYYKKKLIALEKKGLILTEVNPKDKRNKVFYLSPYLFYKGRYMDDSVKKSLVNITKKVHKDIKELNIKENLNIPLDDNFENMTDDLILGGIIEYLNMNETA